VVVVVSTPSTSSTATAPAWSVHASGTRAVGALCARDEGRVYDPSSDANEGEPEQRTSDLFSERLWSIAAIVLVSAPPASVAVAVLGVALVGKNEPVFHAAAALQDIWVLGVVVALADDVRGPELELFGQRGSARPLDVVLVVVGACILAAHHVDFIVPACGAADAFELVYGLVGAMNQSKELKYLWQRAYTPVRSL
jgi:hypothetical protein